MIVSSTRSDAAELSDEQLLEKLQGLGAVMIDAALPAKVKELIALAIAATRECDGCIAAHASGTARQGASEAEVAEAMGVVVLMNGGPGTVWARARWPPTGSTPTTTVRAPNLTASPNPVRGHVTRISPAEAPCIRGRSRSLRYGCRPGARQ